MEETLDKDKELPILWLGNDGIGHWHWPPELCQMLGCLLKFEDVREGHVVNARNTYEALKIILHILLPEGVIIANRRTGLIFILEILQLLTSAYQMQSTD